MGLQVYVMRHGETEGNVRRILLGRGDSPFTEAGCRHPVEVARHLPQGTISRIYCSPMERTQRTAALVLKALGDDIPLELEVAIAEIDAGEFTGLSFAEVRRHVPDAAVLGRFRYPGGESWGDVQARAVRFVMGLEARHDGDAVLLVTHAGIISSLVAEYHGGPIETYIQVRFGHDFLGRLRVASGRIVEYDQIVGTVDSWY